MLKRAKNIKNLRFAHTAKPRFMIYHIESISRPPACPFQRTALHLPTHCIASAIALHCIGYRTAVRFRFSRISRSSRPSSLFALPLLQLFRQRPVDGGLFFVSDEGIAIAKEFVGLGVVFLLVSAHLLDNCQLSCTIPACHLLDNCQLCCVIPACSAA